MGEEKLEEFKKGEDWKKFKNVIKTKAKAKPKGKGKAKAKAGPMPPAKPEGYPARPLDAMKQFMKEQVGAGKPLGEIARMFRELPDEDRARRSKEALDRHEKHKKELMLFQRKKFVGLAKQKYLGKDDAPKEPKKPLGAYMMFASEKRGDVTRDFPDLKGLAPVQQKIGELWKGLSDEDRVVWTNKEKEEKERYNKELAEYQGTPEYKRYKHAFNRITGQSAIQAKL